MESDHALMGLPTLGPVPNFDLGGVSVEPLPDSLPTRDAAPAILSTTSADGENPVSPPVVTTPSVVDVSVSQIVHTPSAPPLGLAPLPSTVPLDPFPPLNDPFSEQGPPSTSTRGLSKSQGSQVWKDRLAARAREKESAEKGKARDPKGSDQSNYESLGLRLPTKGESVAAHRERMTANEGSLVGTVVEIRDRVKDHAAEHAESHEFVLRGLADVGAMAKQASDVACAMTKIAAPLTDAVNRTMGAVQTTAGVITSHALTLQSHSTAIQSMRGGIQDIDTGLSDVRDSINGLQTQITGLSNTSPMMAPVVVAGNNSLIHTQHPSSSFPTPKRARGNGGRPGNQGRGAGSRVAPIVVHDSATATSTRVLCPPLADTQSQTVVFTVTRMDQDPIETSRRVAAVIPGVGVGAIAHARLTTVTGSTLLQFRSMSMAIAFVDLLRNRDSVTALGASAGFAAYTPSNQTSPPDNGLNNVLNILSHPVQGN